MSQPQEYACGACPFCYKNTEEYDEESWTPDLCYNCYGGNFAIRRALCLLYEMKSILDEILEEPPNPIPA